MIFQIYFKFYNVHLSYTYNDKHQRSQCSWSNNFQKSNILLQANISQLFEAEA